MSNRIIEQYLRAFVHHRPSIWHRFLPWTEYHYNTAYHTTASMTPYEVVYGKKPPTISTYLSGTSSNAACDVLLSDRTEILGILRKNLLKAQERMKLLAIEHRSEVNFNIDTYVHVKLQPYRQSSLSDAKYNKLQKRYYGPFRVLERIGIVAYKLELPSYSKIHNVFHCSLLKPYVGPIPPAAPILPPESVDNHPLVTPLAILDSRIVNENGQQLKQVLVQWSGLPPDDTNWENWDDIKTTHNLEDKVDFDGEGIDIEAGPADEQPNIRPIRKRRFPAKFDDHVIYK